jgi:hypothetical protein
MEGIVSIDSCEAPTTPPLPNYGGSSITRAVKGADRFRKHEAPEMTRDEAYARCPADSYVELYGHQWLIIPFAPIEQPRFFVCTPGL